MSHRRDGSWISPSPCKRKDSLPAAKLFVSWKGAAPECGVGGFLDPTLFKVAGGVAFPAGMALVVEEMKKPAVTNDDEMLRRMMGGRWRRICKVEQ